PVMLEDCEQTLWVAEASLREARQSGGPARDQYSLGTLGISDSERNELRERLAAASRDAVDPVVSFLVSATNGIAYAHLIGGVKKYPIPACRMPRGEGKVLLDIGCNWGRWCVAAARAGYSPIGIDPSLGAVLAAKRVSAQLGVPARFVVGDARRLP